jgi:two-component system chemotaxis response regulator CheB
MRGMDVAQESAAEACEDKVIGVLLNGMGKDGAEGRKAIAQDEFISVIFGMPKAAIDRGVVDKVAALPDIVDEIMSVL